MSDDSTAEAAERARATFANYQQQVREDRSLSDEGKREKIAAARESTNRQIDALREKSDAARADEYKRLEKLLCSPPSTLSASPADRIARDASYRDALDRARRTDPQKPAALIELFHQAQRTSDTLQARAAMVIALERNNLDVLNAWAEANPSYEAELQRFYDLSGPQRHAMRDRVAESLKWANV